jgi:ATP-dependent DNA helicase RecG
VASRLIASARISCGARVNAVSETLPAIADLAGVGERSAPLFRALGIATAKELLDYFPFRYDDWREPVPSLQLRAAAKDATEVNALGRVVAVKERRVRRDFEIVEVRAEDESGGFIAKWMGYKRYAFGRFHEGMRIFVRGRLERSLAEPLINVAHYRILAEDEVYRGEMIPVYRASRDLPSRKIAAVVKKNLAHLIGLAGEDALPEAIVQARSFPPLPDAYRMVHAPVSPEEAARARARFVFTECLVLAAGTRLRRAHRESEHDAAALHIPETLLAQLEASIPFHLTAAQRRVIAEIWNDMARDVPMNRLLQGDVGSGKTLVAAAAILLAQYNGYQSALMAPTEILAMQHMEKLNPLLTSFRIGVEPILGNQTPRERGSKVQKLKSGEAMVAIGTHALISEDVDFKRLGLVIIDEQHRFGVEHRARLRAKGNTPHTLHMTATPIPRTLAQTVYADLDVSEIDELPPGRTPVETFAVRFARIAEVYDFVRAIIRRGGQAYVVAPSIDESETGATSVLAEYERLRTEVFADLRVDLVHGRLSGRDKDAVMKRFARGEIDILVATTVIEVGVDVPNANLMVVLDAQRYGLAQLHQLRGRVGRSADRSFCILVYSDESEEGKRLEILTRTSDGFQVAQVDLEMRGAGEFAGTAQHGKSELRFGNLARDFAVYQEARREAERIISCDPLLVAPQNAGLRAALDATPSLHALLTSS